ncbi:hypothetical protein BH11PLA1_BH11PLA1_12640 [soil metagenome]
MHIVTKILIVFAAVLALVLAALTIAYASNADTVRTTYSAEKNAKMVAQNLLGVERADIAKREADMQAARLPLQTELASLNDQVKKLSSERSELIADRKLAEGRVDTLQNQFNELTVTTQTQTTLIKTLKDEVDGSRKSQLDTARQLAEVIERLNESERTRQVLDQTARSLREQLEETKISAEAAKNAGGSTGSGAGAMGSDAVRAVEPPGQRVTGRVTRVFKSPAGDDLAAINLGSAAGLKAGQKLNIVRDGFVASLILMNVDTNESVGRVEKLGREVTVNTEDIVLSRLD